MDGLFNADAPGLGDPAAADLRSHVGVVVRDLDQVAAFYEKAFALGPFERGEIRAKGLRILTASAPLGRCEMELIEVVGGRPPHQEFLERVGEGMNHFNLDYQTADGYLGRMLHLHQMDVLPYWGFPHSGFCYVNSDRIGGVHFEVMRGSGHAGKKGFHHLGLVVKDTAATIDYYTKQLGLLPFRTNTFPMKNATYKGGLIDAAFKASFTELGQLRLELMQIVEGDTPMTGFLAERGEGMHHLRFAVADPAARLAELKAKGVGVLWQNEEAGLTLLDTAGTGGMIFAISGRP